MGQPAVRSLAAVLAICCTAPAAAEPKHDPLTTIAVATTNTFVGSLLHEGAGHALACRAFGSGGQLTVSFVACDREDALGTGELRWLYASGTLLNLTAGALSMSTLELAPPSSGVGYYSLWLFSTTNVFTGGGYLMADSIFQFGDWANFNSTFDHDSALRIGEFVTGAGIYVGGFLLARERLEPLLGDESGRRGRTAFLTLIPYGVSSVLLPLASGLQRKRAAFVSAALASLGGLSGLAWMWAYVDPTGAPSQLAIERSWPVVATGAVSLVGLALLGRGFTF